MIASIGVSHWQNHVATVGVISRTTAQQRGTSLYGACKASSADRVHSHLSVTVPKLRNACEGVARGGPMLAWTTKRKLLATGLFCLSLAAPGVASAASNGVPTADIATTCRTSEKALIAIF